MKSILSFLFKNKKQNIKKLEIKEFLPKDFLNLALSDIIYHKGTFGFKKDNWEVVNCYFAGATFCLDVKNDELNIEDVITICSDNTFGFFVNSSYTRSNLSLEEIDKLNILRENYLTKEKN